MIHTNWQVSKHNCHKNPLPHIYCKNFIKLDIYDRLYEQWNNHGHEHWQKFITENHVDVYFHEDFVKCLSPKKITGYIGYWFFRQRTDKSAGGDIVVSNGREEKILTYYQNTVLILDTNSSFFVKTRNESLPTRPFCEIYFDEITNKKIKEVLS